MSVITEKSEVDIVVAIKCDKCGFCAEDVMDMQEFSRIGDTGGYSSKWGDGTTWNIDLCSQCSYNIFHEYAEIE